MCDHIEADIISTIVAALETVTAFHRLRELVLVTMHPLSMEITARKESLVTLRLGPRW